MSTDDAAGRKPTSKPVGVPRRFAVGTLMVIVTMYSVLFASLTSLGAHPVVFGVVAIFFTGVGVGQVVFFKGNRPRDASYLSGILLCPGMLLAAFLADRLFGLSAMSPEHVGIETVPQLLSAMAYLAMVGAVLGYMAGCATAGVFFVMDRIKKAREDPDAETDRPQASATDDLTPDERPSLDERLWLPVRGAIIGLSPRQKGRPVRGALNVFIIVGTLVGLAAPFQPWAWWIYLLGTATAAFVLAFLRGAFLCRWKAALALVVLGAVGAIGPGVILSRICLYPGLSIPDHMPLVLAVVAGGLIGLLAVPVFGWARWLLEGRNGARRRGKLTGRLGVITAVCLILLCGAVSLWLYRISQQPQQRAIARVKRLGGVAMNWSAWRSRTVNYVDMEGTIVRDADLQCLSVFGNLSHLTLRDTQISDAGLAHLKCLSGLRFLDLEGTRITDTGLEHLQGLSSLTVLSLAGTQVTDAGLQSLKDLTSLSYLGLKHTLVTDAGVKQLQVVPSLSSLDLTGTQVTSSGLKHLKKMTGLIHLDLTDCEVTDAGLEHLNGLTELWNLDLSGTQVTDAGLVHLKGLSNLDWLNLRDTRVTKAGAEKLEQALPNCSVHR